MKVQGQDPASHRRMAWNVGWNLVAAGVPLVAAVVAVPRLVATLGTARFGLLGLIWAAVGYVTVFDLGFGRALTKLAAERLGDGRGDEIGALAVAGLRTIALTGLAVGLGLATASGWIVNDLLSAPPALRHEAVVS